MADIDVSPPNICDPMVVPPFPTVPAGISLTPALPGIGHVFSARLCCKVFNFQIAAVGPPIAGGINFGILAALNTQIQLVNAYLRLLPVKCPKEASF